MTSHTRGNHRDRFNNPRMIKPMTMPVSAVKATGMKRAAGPGIAITRFAASASKLPWVRCNSPTGAILSFRVGETAAFVSCAS